MKKGKRVRRKLVSFDTDRIKEYVFATGRLKEIRGASAILDEFNRRDMVEIGKKSGAEKIYANGGSGMFVVPEESAEGLIRAVEKEYRLRTRTGSLTGALADLPHGFSRKCDVRPHLQLLSYRLRLKKDENTLRQPLLTHPFLRTCDSCGEEYASRSVKVPEPELLCASCKNKRGKNVEAQKDVKGFIDEEVEYGKHKLWHRLLGKLKKAGYCMAGKDRPEDFGDIGDMSRPGNYMGLIYADGDGMGKTLESLANLKEVKEFSEVVDGAIYQAVGEAILEHLPSGDKYFPFDVLMIGGDDLVMVTTAHKALEVAMKIIQRFSEISEEKFGKQLTLSVGVAIAHAKFPFSGLLNLAEQALKFSKKEAVKRRRRVPGETAAEGLINFIVVSNSNSLDFDDYYRETLSEEEQRIRRTLRPYSVGELRRIVETIRCLKGKRFPRGKLKRLRDAVFQNRNRSIVTGAEFLARDKRDKDNVKIFTDFLAGFAVCQKSFPWHFPWNKDGDDYHTPLFDLIELYDFIEER